MRATNTVSQVARRTGLALAIGFCVSGFISIESLFAPDAKLWERWLAHEPQSTATIGFGDWNRLLSVYVRPSESGVNHFDYAEVTPEDREALDAFLARMAAISISRHARQEQLAYWINLYNALTVRVILDHYPVDSIRDIGISPGLFAKGPWGKKLITVEGEELSLNDIEHRILRPIWRDPRIHYAVNCAAIGCPNLQPTAYTGQQVESRLDAAARDYVNDPRGVFIANGRVTVSKIYDWFGEDFGGTASAVLAHLTQYAEPALAARLEEIGEIHDTAYDWRLNERCVEIPGPPQPPEGRGPLETS